MPRHRAGSWRESVSEELAVLRGGQDARPTWRRLTRNLSNAERLSPATIEHKIVEIVLHCPESVGARHSEYHNAPRYDLVIQNTILEGSHPRECLARTGKPNIYLVVGVVNDSQRIEIDKDVDLHACFEVGEDTFVLASLVNEERLRQIVDRYRPRLNPPPTAKKARR